MIVVRNVFNLKFGKAKEAKALIEENQSLLKKNRYSPARYLTDITGPFYRLEMEIVADNLTEYEKSQQEMMKSKEFSEWYQRFTPLVESGSREIYSVVE